MILSRTNSLIFLSSLFLFWGCGSEPTQINNAPTLIPLPSLLEFGDGQFVLSRNVYIAADERLQQEAAWLQSWLFEKFQFSQDVHGDIVEGNKLIILELSDTISKNPEAYELSVNSTEIRITGQKPVGVFRGLQALRQLFPLQTESGKSRGLVAVKEVRIKDEPAFPHRGLLFDCCRHFMDVPTVKKYIDALAYYRMNTFHWHLTEDQGWRIEINKYPKLTEVGAWRMGEDGQPYGGYYSQDDIREIVAYATARHINVIPEIELPGHSSAAIAAYPHLSCTGDSIEVITEWGVFKDIYCAGNDTTIQFLKDVLDEVIELFPSQYIHIGGDEAPKYRWEQCVKCQHRIRQMGLHDEHGLQSWFIDEIGDYLHSKGKKLIGWDEIHEGGLPEGAIVQSWRGMEGGLEAARQGHFAIMSPTSHCYFDYGLDATNLEEVYSFDPMPEGITDDQKQFILGGEGNMWTERAPQNIVDSKVFPRLLALSEVLWSYPETRNFEEFRHRLDAHYQVLEGLGIDYGFEAVPLVIETSVKEDHISVDLNRLTNDMEVKLKRGSVFTKLDSNYLEVRSERDLQFQVTKNGKNYPEPIRANITFHSGLDASATLLHSYSPWYTGGGDGALLDGRRGTLDFRDGCWQAVQGEDMGMVLDLGSDKSISAITTHFYQYNNAWIFLPSEVVFDLSNDGSTWFDAQTISHEIAQTEKEQLIETFHVSFEKSTKVRYVRMRAMNMGANPEWHDSPGMPSWLFCDELVLKTLPSE